MEMSLGRQRPEETMTKPLPFCGSSRSSVIMCSWNWTIWRRRRRRVEELQSGERDQVFQRVFEGWGGLLWRCCIRLFFLGRKCCFRLLQLFGVPGCFLIFIIFYFLMQVILRSEVGNSTYKLGCSDICS